MYKAPESVPKVKNDNPFPNEPTIEDSPWLLEPSINEHIERMRYEERVYGEWYSQCYLDGLHRMTVTFITMRDRLVNFSNFTLSPSSLFFNFKTLERLSQSSRLLSNMTYKTRNYE